MPSMVGSAARKATDPEAPPQRGGGAAAGVVLLNHKLFRTAEDLVFKKADTGDGCVCAFTLGGNTFAIDLDKLALALGITPEDPDHAMLRLIGRGLQFIASLQVGDRMPAEILTGEASFQPTGAQVERAMRRLKGQLTCWLAGTEHRVTDQTELARIADDPSMRERVQEAFRAATAALELDPSNSDEVVRRIEVLGRELASIEFLRDRLLQPLFATCVAVDSLRAGALRDATRTEMTGRVSALLKRAMDEAQIRIHEVDGATGEIMPMLRGMDLHQGVIREARDFLYARLIAWGELLPEATRLGTMAPAQSDALINKLYRFLAARYLPAQVWVNMMKSEKASDNRTMTW